MLVLWLSCVDLSRLVLECCEDRPDDHDDPKSTVKSVDHPGDVSSRLYKGTTASQAYAHM
jgi:hypothetical protein